jgi:Fe-S cluster biogenesis protein NfuA
LFPALRQPRPLPPRDRELSNEIPSIPAGTSVALPEIRQVFAILSESRLPLELSMLSRDRVESVLDRIRPMMQADGGDIELIDVQGNSARVRLTGMCAGCPSAHMTLYMGVEMALRDEIKEFEELQVV